MKKEKNYAIADYDFCPKCGEALSAEADDELKEVLLICHACDILIDSAGNISKN